MVILVGIEEALGCTFCASWLATAMVCPEEYAPQEQVAASETLEVMKFYEKTQSWCIG